jgi:hypothetical protein
VEREPGGAPYHHDDMENLLSRSAYVRAGADIAPKPMSTDALAVFLNTRLRVCQYKSICQFNGI